MMRRGLGLRLGDIAASAAAAVPKSTLVDDLVSYWSLDETSGTRVDSVGGNDLTDNNTVGVSPAGPSGTVASFVAANSETLSKSSAGIGGASFTVALWAKNDPTGADGWLAELFIDNNNRWNLYTISDTIVSQWDESGNQNNEAQLPADSASPAWRFIVTGYNATTHKTFISVNGSAITYTSATLTDKDFSGGAFQLGIAATSNFANIAGMGRVGAWSRVLDASDVTSLFNSGVGKSYADLTTAEKVGLVSYWDLDEESDGSGAVTRNDSHGTNHLTDNGTTASATAVAGAMHNAAASFVKANAESLSGAALINTLIPSGSMTISLWARQNAQATGVLIRQGTTGGTTEGFGMYYSVDHANAFDVYWSDGTHQANAYSAAFNSSDGFHHYLFVFDKDLGNYGVGQVYVDGVAGTAASMEYATSITNTDFAIARFSAASVNWDGLIDEVAIWSRVLTEDERAELYAAGDGKFYNSTTEDFE